MLNDGVFGKASNVALLHILKHVVDGGFLGQ
jgi:hypothetical protein